MRKLFPLLGLCVFLSVTAPAPVFAATDTFTGGSGLLSAHDANWTLGDTGSGESLANWSIDGSGFAIINATFKGPYIYYAGTDCTTQKSEIVVPIGAFATVPGASSAMVLTCVGTSNKGFEAMVGASQLTGQVVTAVRVASNGSFVSSASLSPTIDTASVALTMSLQRTSTTNVNLIVNGTTYPINTTGVDIVSGFCGMAQVYASGTNTIKIDSWTNGVAGSSTVINPISGGGGTAARPVTFLDLPEASNDDVFLKRVTR
jgi:hypothetical protein